MHDVTAIVRGAFHGLLQDVAEQYRHLQPMAPTDRDAYVQGLRSRGVEISSKIEGAETQDAVRILLRFQYASRIIYRDDENRRSHYSDSYRWEKWEEGKEIASWRWSPPTEADFNRVVLSWSAKVDFYTLVNEFCSEIFGLPIPGGSETFEEYLLRAGIEEASWRWQYDGALKKEQDRWFTSSRKIAEIEAQRKSHRARATQCSAFLAAFFPRIRPSSDLLQNLKRLELTNSSSLHAAEHAPLCQSSCRLDRNRTLGAIARR
jgi:hypothetical protein